MNEIDVIINGRTEAVGFYNPEDPASVARTCDAIRISWDRIMTHEEAKRAVVVVRVPGQDNVVHFINGETREGRLHRSEISRREPRGA